MIKTITIGTMVLCHLYSGTPATTAEEKPKIIKVLGEVIDMSKAPMYLENVERKETLQAEKDMLTVRATNSNGIYQISARACMVVRKETPEETQARKIIKKEIKPKASGVELQNGPTIDDEEPPPPEFPPEPVLLETKPAPEIIEEVPAAEMKEEPKKIEPKNSAPQSDKKGILDYIVN